PTDLAASIRRLLGIEKPAPITTYPSVEAPHAVVVKTIFRVDVTTRAEPPNEAAAPIVLPRKGPGAVDLEVEVELPADGSFGPRPAPPPPPRAPGPGDPAPLAFRLFAKRPGKRTTPVRFRPRGLGRAALRRDVGVVTAAEAAASPPVAAIGHTSAVLW